jgi:hypothetical protein
MKAFIPSPITMQQEVSPLPTVTRKLRVDRFPDHAHLDQKAGNSTRCSITRQSRHCLDAGKAHPD